MSGPVVVLGIGNPLRGDDGVGPAVLALLAGRVPPGVRLVASDGEPTRLMEQWRDAGTAVVVDAATGGGPPGSLRTFVLRPGDTGPLGRAVGTSSHGLGLAGTLALAAALGRAPGEVVVHAVEAGSTAHGAGLSPAVRRAAGAVAERVLADLADGWTAPGSAAGIAPGSAAGTAAGTKPSTARDVRP